MIYCFEDFELDTRKHVLRCNGEEIKVEPQVFDLLTLLVKNHDRLVTKDEIIETIWHGRAISETAISSRISSARSAINDDGKQQRLIKTRHNKGLRFMAVPRTIGMNGVEETQKVDEHPLIIVLPFLARADDELEALTAEALADEITTLLSFIKGLKVAPQYVLGRTLDPEVDPAEIARSVGAKYVVTGSVRRNGNRLRVMSELTNLVENNLVWSEKFDRTMEDIFAIQDEVARGVVGSLGGRIASIEAARAVRRPPESLRAWELARRAHAVAWDWRPETMEQGVADCRRAIELDPNYAHAHAYLGLYLAWQCVQGWSRDHNKHKLEARVQADRALRLSNDDAEVLSAAGEIYRLIGSPGRAIKIYDDATARNSDTFTSWPFALPLIGLTYAQLGQEDKGLELIKEFESKFPSNDLGRIWSRVILGYVELCRRNYDRVVELHANPPSEFNAVCRLIALVRMNRFSDARIDLNRILKLNSSFSIDHYIDYFAKFHANPEVSVELSLALIELKDRALRVN
jgi:TolB-like protein